MGNLFSNTMRKFLFFLPSSYDEQGVTQFDGSLPPDSMLEILQRLHSKPLIQFLLVSKAWHSVILSPAFIEKHQTYHQDKSISFLHPYRKVEKGVCLISKKTGHEDAITDVPLPFDVEPTIEGVLPNCFSKVYFLGCSNGLVCIRLVETTFFCIERTRFGLWNPATRQFKLLPSPKIVMHRPPEDHELFGSIDGFSYVPRIKDYKLVRILVFKDKRSQYLVRALVLNVAKKSWRELKNHELPNTRFHHHLVVTKGCMHLLVFRPEGGQDSYNHPSLLSFDLDEEIKGLGIRR